jgi:hypothetical protein
VILNKLVKKINLLDTDQVEKDLKKWRQVTVKLKVKQSTKEEKENKKYDIFKTPPLKWGFLML